MVGPSFGVRDDVVYLGRRGLKADFVVEFDLADWTVG
jgi:hypothetical protein